MKVRNTALTALVLAMGLAAGSASAATATGSFDVTANVGGSCVIAATDAIAFGTYDPTATHAATDLDAQGRIAVRCTAGSTNVRVSLNQGNNATTGSTAEAPARQMKSGDDVISYGIFQDTARSQVWGAGATSDVTMGEFVSSLVPVELVTYGRISGGQNAAIGSYSDTVAVTVTF